MLKKFLPCVIIFMLFVSAAGAETIKLKIAVVNPSKTEAQAAPVKFDLPKGIMPQHIIDRGDMDMGYDFEKGCYYVYKKLTLEPSERRTLEVELENIWIVPPSEIEFLEQHTAVLLTKLEDSEHYEIGADMSKKIARRLKEISASQTLANLSTKEKINLYYVNVETLKQVKADIGLLENLVIDAGDIVEDRVEIPPTLAVPVFDEGKPESYDIIELKIKLTNPSEGQKQVANLQYALPQEITPKYIVDSGGIEINYNFEKECFYAVKEGIELEPLQAKDYVIKVRDVWRIPELELEALESHTNNLLLLLRGTAYYSQGVSIADRIFSDLRGIVDSQNRDLSVVEHIAHFRDNVGIFKKTQEYVSQLEGLISRAKGGGPGRGPGVTVAKAKKDAFLLGGKMGNLPEKGEDTGVSKGVAFIAKSIFAGKAPEVTTTWKTIFIIIGFVGIISAVFFRIWHVQVKAERRKREELLKTERKE